MKKTPAETKKALVVTTQKGVFFGYGTVDPASKLITLENARMAIYWSAASKGVVGLAAGGPAQGSRISLAAPVLYLNDITAVMEASPEAIVAWEKGPWN